MIAKDERCLRIGVLAAGRSLVRPSGRLPQGQECRALRHLRPGRRSARAHGRDPSTQGRPIATTTPCWPTHRSTRSSSLSPTSSTSRPPEGARGRKHVLVEKPLGTTVESCRELRDRAAATKLVVQVGNNRRFDPGIAFARQFIAEEMGQRIAFKSWYYDSVYRYTMTDNLQPIPVTSSKCARARGRSQGRSETVLLVLTHGSHLVDTARFLGGPIVAFHARLLERFGAYCWFIAVDFDDGSLGHLDLQIPVRGDFQEGFQVFGEHGSVTGRVHLPWFHKSSDVECFSTKDRQFHRVLGEDAHTYKRQIEGFAATILDGCRAGASLDDGLAAVQAMVAIARSVETADLRRLDEVSGVSDATGDLRQDISATDARGDARRGVAHGLTQSPVQYVVPGLPDVARADRRSVVHRIARCFRERGLTMAAISGTFNICDPDPTRLQTNLRRLDLLAAACRWLDTRIITLCTGTGDLDDMWRRHGENVRRKTWETLVAVMKRGVSDRRSKRGDAGLRARGEQCVNSVNQGSSAAR